MKILPFKNNLMIQYRIVDKKNNKVDNMVYAEAKE